MRYAPGPCGGMQDSVPACTPHDLTWFPLCPSLPHPQPHQIINALEEDPAAQKMQLAFRLQQIAAALENKVTDL
jgi:hypothetical protein